MRSSDGNIFRTMALLPPSQANMETESCDSFDDELEGDVEANLLCPHPLSCALACLTCPCAALMSVKMFDQNEHGAVLVWGAYKGSITQPGIQFVNPCGVEIRKVSTMRQTLDVKDVQVADKDGNPIIMSGNVAYRIFSAKKAEVDTRNPIQYVCDQAPMVLRKIGSRFHYDELRGDSAGESLKAELQKAVSEAGVQVLKFQLTDLQYSPLIAQAMLGKQQAIVQVQAKQSIVLGAADTAAQTVRRLRDSGHPFSADAEQRLIHDLLLKNLDPDYKASTIFTAMRQ
jgi:regulator of protease activity HflC (stomatin/prohibitin superfamily)